jgi:RHS repeat-associated protein
MLADHQGSIRQIVDNGGALLNQITYDSYGNITNQTNPSVTFRFGYTGREWDGETGQYYYRARYYDARVGRFLSTDPIGFAAGDANLYRYVFNSPMNFTDPSGLRTEIYIHSGKNWYGHTAININGTVYTFGRYEGAQAKPMTRGVKGEGYFYIVNERYYLNNKSFTPPEDRVARYQIQLTPEEERRLAQRYRELFEKATKPKTDNILGRDGFSSQAHGRKLKDNYHLLANNCTTIITSFLPQRVQTEFGSVDTRFHRRPFNPNWLAPFTPNLNPAGLESFLDLASSQKPALVRELPSVLPDPRRR